MEILVVILAATSIFFGYKLFILDKKPKEKSDGQDYSPTKDFYANHIFIGCFTMRDIHTIAKLHHKALTNEDALKVISIVKSEFTIDTGINAFVIWMAIDRVLSRKR